MNVMIRTILLAAVMTAACGLAPCTAQGQDAKNKPAVMKKSHESATDPNSCEVQVFTLQHGYSPSVVKTIKEIYDGLPDFRVSVVDKTNSLTVMAQASKMLEIRQLIAQLDKEKALDKDQQFRMRIIQLKNQPDDALAKTLELLLAGDGGEYSLDRARRQIVFKSRDWTSKNVDEFIARWDVATPAAAAPPSSDVQIRVVWISSDAEVAASRPLPDDLKPLIPAFKKIGLDKPFAAATYTVTTTPNAEFSTVGAAYGLSTLLRISGQYGDRKSSPNLAITIRDVTEEVRQIDIISELTAPMGHLIVLGATTVGGNQQQMAFVVQVSRPDSVNLADKP